MNNWKIKFKIMRKCKEIVITINLLWNIFQNLLKIKCDINIHMYKYYFVWNLKRWSYVCVCGRVRACVCACVGVGVCVRVYIYNFYCFKYPQLIILQKDSICIFIFHLDFQLIMERFETNKKNIIIFLLFLIILHSIFYYLWLIK